MTSPNAQHLITRLRRLLGHLSAKDRVTVAESITAIAELSMRLHEATHGLAPAFTVRQVEEEEYGVDSDR